MVRAVGKSGLYRRRGIFVQSCTLLTCQAHCHPYCSNFTSRNPKDVLPDVNGCSIHVLGATSMKFWPSPLRVFRRSLAEHLCKGRNNNWKGLACHARYARTAPIVASKLQATRALRVNQYSAIDAAESHIFSAIWTAPKIWCVTQKQSPMHADMVPLLFDSKC